MIPKIPDTRVLRVVVAELVILSSMIAGSVKLTDALSAYGRRELHFERHGEIPYCMRYGKARVSFSVSRGTDDPLISSG
jgi:hypothetical protein